MDEVDPNTDFFQMEIDEALEKEREKHRGKIDPKWSSGQPIIFDNPPPQLPKHHIPVAPPPPIQELPTHSTSWTSYDLRTFTPPWTATGRHPIVTIPIPFVEDKSTQ